MSNRTIDTLIGGVTEITRNLYLRPINAQDKLARDILALNSAHIVGFFLDTERRGDITFHYREVALAAAVRLINDTETDSGERNYLRVLIDDIAEAEYDELQADAKEMLVFFADDKELSEIALNESEDIDIRVSAVERINDLDMLIDVAADADEEDVRQAAKMRVKKLR